ncbi:MoaD/ThiS family protein [Sulfurospirillum arcachonense]|uniref:MoaD/ThiS family protein n=1 Tax=Sulfurospirillum arcachonense TaxID=57666 RepID=UPI00046AB6E9|nr:MoaD/ThiS family protein [Sulfurospirillum arcachonense]
MIKITFNAFSFLRENLKKQNIPYINSIMELPEHYTPNALINDLGYEEGKVEFVFINGKVHPKNTELKDGDRVALVPPGTPGSYRLMLGAKKIEKLED